MRELDVKFINDIIKAVEEVEQTEFRRLRVAK
jgi:hypothetical protein